jgi:hypothetical protein
VAIVGVSRSALACSTNWPPGARALVDRGLHAEFVGGAGLAFADALDLGSVEGIELPAALALLLGADLVGTRDRIVKACVSAVRMPMLSWLG